MSYRNYYDSSPYSRPRDTGRVISNISTDRPTAVTAKYINTTPSYKSSSIPVLSNDRSSREETPISAIANRYSNYSKSDKSASKYEKKDYTSKLTVPPPVIINKSRDVSPVSTSSKYSLSRSSCHLSPDRRTIKNLKEKTRDASPVDREKHIPNKTDKSTGYSGLSSYKLYPRTPSYSRPASRTETKPEVTVNRYAIANRLSSSYLRSPTPVKRTSLSPVSYIDTSKNENDKPLSPSINEEADKATNEFKNDHVQNGNEIKVDNNENIETISVITRHTSPTPPGSSSYVRSRRADMAKTVEKIITRTRKKPETADKEVQSDRLDDPTRSNRFGSTSRTSLTNWTFYAPNSNNYTGYAGRYSTQYSNLRDNSTSNSYDRSSRSHSTEPLSRENATSYSHSESNKDKCLENNIAPSEINEQTNFVSEPHEADETSDIVINVNLKLKKAKSPIRATDLVSPEITITSNQLPPQAPKSDTTGKIKKLKVRKSSTDSSSDSSSKKKVLKKRSKSVSSTDSEQGNDKTDNSIKESRSSKIGTKSSISSNSPKSSKSKHSKSRESNSPESSITLSTQSSISEDESVSKSKTRDISRTSADEISIPTDRSSKPPLSVNSNKGDGGTEEAKSFLIRALAPVTNLFKLRYQDSSDNTRWLENSTSESTGKDISNLTTESNSNRSKNATENSVASNDDNLVKLKAIRHIESGERAWWLDSESDKKSRSHYSEKPRHNETTIKHSNENLSLQSIDISDDKRQSKKCMYQDDEKPWWLDSSANIPEGIERLTPPRKSSSDSDKSDKFNFFKVRHTESGDKKDWWLTSNENSSNSNKVDTPNSISLSKSGSDQRSFSLRRIRHIESGERPWWLASDKNIPEGVEKLPTPPLQEDSDSSDSEEVRIYIPSSQIPPFPLNLPDDEPLGDRRSPEGLETPKDNEEYETRSSPYENNRKYRRGSSSSLSYQKNAEKYISRYTDIDDILGTSGQIYSPFMDSLLARRTGQMSFDDDECEEIDPTQVRIHDSTPQMPIIKKLGYRSDIVDYRDEDQIQF